MAWKASRVDCPLCRSARTEVVLDKPVCFEAGSDIPLPLELSLCQQCAFVFQSGAFRPGWDEAMARLYANYDGTEIFPFPRRSPDNLQALELIARHLEGVPAPSVLEIGSNKGDLLYLLKERIPTASILGLEPGANTDLAVPTLHAFFSRSLFSCRFDAVLLKQVAEHFKDPRALLADAASLLKDDGILYVEVPNLAVTLRHSTEDFVPEHVGYFTLDTLAQAMPPMHLLAAQEDASLRTLWTARPAVASASAMCARPPASVEPLTPEAVRRAMGAFGAARRAMLAELSAHAAAGGAVVFFGVYSYFRRLYRELAPLLRRENCFFMDDGFAGDVEPVFGLPRRAQLASGDLVVCCSTNASTQDAMVGRLKGAPCRVLVPWRSLDGLGLDDGRLA